jgi:sugar transferase (PEP-CTERM/EpsH1 system associated)
MTVIPPVRVMHLVHTFGVGGMEVGVLKLVNSLNAARIRSGICSSRPAPDRLKDRLLDGVPLFEFNRRDGNDPLFVAQLVRLFRRERPDIVHTHRWGTLLEGLIAARLAGVPYVVHGEHGTLETRPLNVRVQRWTWNRVDRVVAVSSRLAERISKEIAYPLERIQVIRNGLDLKRFTPRDRFAAKRALGLPPDELVIGTVGRLVPVKDHPMLLQSLARLRDRGLRFNAVIAGKGPLHAALIEQAQSLGLTQVRLLGDRDDPERVLNAFDVFVLSSKSEGLSNTIQEAMASGLPVVATRVGGADELVREHETGLLVAAEDPASFADAMHRVAVDQSLREQMGNAGRRRAESVFGIDRMIREYEELYLTVARRAPFPFRKPQTSEA